MFKEKKVINLKIFLCIISGINWCQKGLSPHFEKQVCHKEVLVKSYNLCSLRNACLYFNIWFHFMKWIYATILKTSLCVLFPKMNMYTRIPETSEFPDPSSCWILTILDPCAASSGPVAVKGEVRRATVRSWCTSYLFF